MCRVCTKPRSSEKIVHNKALRKCHNCYHLLDKDSSYCKRKECSVARSTKDKGFHPKNKYKEHTCACRIDGCKKPHISKQDLDDAAAATSFTPYCRDLYLGRPCKNGKFCYYLHDEMQAGRVQGRSAGSSSSSGVSSSSSSSGVSSSLKRSAPRDFPGPQSKAPKVDDRGRQKPKRKEISSSDSENPDESDDSVPRKPRSRSGSSKVSFGEEWTVVKRSPLTVVKRSPPPKRSPERKHSRDRKK